MSTLPEDRTRRCVSIAGDRACAVAAEGVIISLILCASRKAARPPGCGACGPLGLLLHPTGLRVESPDVVGCLQVHAPAPGIQTVFVDVIAAALQDFVAEVG